jgi:hypothetical protein
MSNFAIFYANVKSMMSFSSLETLHTHPSQFPINSCKPKRTSDNIGQKDATQRSKPSHDYRNRKAKCRALVEDFKESCRQRD